MRLICASKKISQVAGHDVSSHLSVLQYQYGAGNIEMGHR